MKTQYRIFSAPHHLRNQLWRLGGTNKISWWEFKEIHPAMWRLVEKYKLQVVPVNETMSAAELAREIKKLREKH